MTSFNLDADAYAERMLELDRQDESPPPSMLWWRLWIVAVILLVPFALYWGL